MSTYKRPIFLWAGLIAAALPAYWSWSCLGDPALELFAWTFGIGALMVAGWGHILAGPRTPRQS